MPKAPSGVGIVVQRQRKRVPGDDEGQATGRSLKALAKGVAGTARSVRRIRERTMAEVIDQQLAAPAVTLDDVQRLLLHHALAALDGTDNPTDLSMRSLDSLARLVAFREQQSAGGAGRSDAQVMDIIGAGQGKPSSLPPLPQPRLADARGAGAGAKGPLPSVLLAEAPDDPEE